MLDIFFSSFPPVFSAIIQVFIVMGLAAFLLKKKIIKDELLVGLSQLTVVVLLPALSFSKIVKGLEPEKMPNWWIIPLVGIAMVTFGILVSRLLFGKNTSKRYLWALSSFQNSTYFILPIGKILYPDDFDQFALYVFLLALFGNPYLWSVGKVLVTNTADINIKKFVTPPFIANMVALFLVLIGLNKYIPDVVLGPLELLGSATVPMATFILGATIGTAKFAGPSSVFVTIRVLLIKYGILPISTILILKNFNIAENYPLLADFFVVQASSAPAAALIIQARNYGDNEKEVGSMMFLSYIVCLFMLPFWLSVWKMM